MKQWLQQILYKLRNYDELWEQNKRYKLLYDKYSKESKDCKKDIMLLEIQSKSMEEKLKVSSGIIAKLRDNLTNQTEPYNEIEKPKYKLADLEKSLQLADKFTMRQISEYLKLDSYELVKNMAKIMNKDNASEVMAHRDGALQRNENLIKILEKLTVEKTFQDKFTGQKKTI